jgi:hypothetical protein
MEVTEHKSFKRLVRARMEKTGESYTAARAQLLAGDAATGDEKPVLATSDDAIRARRGRGWEEWFDALDEWGAGERPHREIARWLAEQLGIEPLAWNVQAITVSYERARGGRAVGEHPEGFAITASKTVAAPVERLFDAFVDESSRRRWLPDGKLRDRKSTRPKSARFDWGEGERVNVTFDAKGEAKSTVTVSHERLPDAREAERMQAYWRARVEALKRELAG